MRLAILGGGGFRTPLVYAALAFTDSGVTEVVLYDTDSARLDVMASVLASVSSVEGAESARALGYTSTGNRGPAQSATRESSCSSWSSSGRSSSLRYSPVTR